MIGVVTIDRMANVNLMRYGRAFVWKPSRFQTTLSLINYASARTCPAATNQRYGASHNPRGVGNKDRPVWRAANYRDAYYSGYATSPKQPSRRKLVGPCQQTLPACLVKRACSGNEVKRSKPNNLSKCHGLSGMDQGRYRHHPWRPCSCRWGDSGSSDLLRLRSKPSSLRARGTNRLYASPVSVVRARRSTRAPLGGFTGLESRLQGHSTAISVSTLPSEKKRTTLGIWGP